MNARRQPIVYVPLTPAMRLRLEATIEQLIGLLDEIDGDADLEPGGDNAEDDARDWVA